MYATALRSDKGHSSDNPTRATVSSTFKGEKLVRPPSFAAAVIVSTVAACSSASTQVGKSPRPANANEVVISDYKFVPQTLTVPIGTTITWVNHDIARHTVTRHTLDEPFDSGLLGNQEVFSHTFRTAGSYGYLCVPHSGMQGTIVVQ
jgi:plastocyanin